MARPVFKIRALRKKFLRNRKKHKLFRLWKLRNLLLAVPSLLMIALIITLWPQAATSPAAAPDMHGVAEQVFADVEIGNPAFEAVAYLKQQDMIEGFADGNFKPDGTVTRAELLKFLFEAQKIYPSPAVYRACFRDIRDQWFASYVCYAKAKNLLAENLTENRAKKFVPTQNVTGTEAMEILAKAFNTNAKSLDVGDALLTRGQLAQVLYQFLR